MKIPAITKADKWYDASIKHHGTKSDYILTETLNSITHSLFLKTLAGTKVIGPLVFHLRNQHREKTLTICRNNRKNPTIRTHKSIWQRITEGNRRKTTTQRSNDVRKHNLLIMMKCKSKLLCKALRSNNKRITKLQFLFR